MRILYYCNEYFCSHGARTHAREFVAALRELPEVDYVKVMSDNSESAAELGAVEMREKKKRSLLRRFLSFFIPRRRLSDRIVGEATDGRFDCLVIRANPKNMLIGRMKKKLPRLIVCVEINAAYFDEDFHGIWFRPMWQSLEARRYKKADCLVVVSSWLRDYFVTKGLDERKISVNPNGVNLAQFQVASERIQNFRQKAGVPDRAFVIGYVGGMERFRRLPEVVQSVAALRKSGIDNLFLVLVGDGEDRVNVDKAISDNSAVLQGWVSCMGWQRYEDIPAIIGSFDVAIFPFTNPYCSPIKLFEYLGVERPTIGPKTPAVEELFNDGEHLFLVEQTGKDFERALGQLIAAPKRCHALATAGRAYVEQHYQWKHNAQRVMDSIKKVDIYP